ncbi:exported hypothetical protein [groundwater metagenome]|uniref:LamG-like jellyroll fold domain-containing protein n=1 Tax=groundwater metagenome TaxID=717931 RepID=A0A098EES0_9ZZZZ
MQWKIKDLSPHYRSEISKQVLKKHYVIASLILVCFFCSLSLVNADKFNNEQGLVAYYSFDEGEGNITLDMSGNCNDGMIYGAKWADGKYGKALYFNKSNYVNCENDSSLNIADKITIEVWIKPLNWNNSEVIISNNLYSIFHRGEWAGNRIYFLYKVNNYGINNISVSQRPGDTAWETWGGVAMIDAGEIRKWHHIAAVKSSNIMSIYLDGMKKKELNCLSGFIINSSQMLNLTIGSYFNGSVDEIKIYNRALTETEIKAEYDYQSEYKNLKAHDLLCSNDSECKTNNCFKGTCKESRYCENHSDCYSCHYCEIENNKCRPLKEIDFPCLNDSECKTKICSKGICKKKRDEERGEANLPRPEKTSKGKAYINEVNKSKNECNFDFDCLPSRYCDKNNKCKNLKDENFACSKDTECKTNNCYYEVCKDDGYVAIWNFIIGTFMLVFTILIFFLPGFALTLIKKRNSNVRKDSDIRRIRSWLKHFGNLCFK